MICISPPKNTDFASPRTGIAGSYRLSSYYIAKMIGELPLVIALPSAFHLISYPLLGYHSFYTFVSLWGFAILK